MPSFTLHPAGQDSDKVELSRIMTLGYESHSVNMEIEAQDGGNGPNILPFPSSLVRGTP